MVWKPQGFQPLPPKPGQAVHLPSLPAHRPASRPAFTHQGKSAIISAWWYDHRTQEA